MIRIIAVLMAILLTWVPPAQAGPGLCVGPVCADNIQRSAKHHWQLRLRAADQMGNHERLVVDCRTGTLSPELGPVARGYALALARRACRLARMPEADAQG